MQLKNSFFLFIFMFCLCEIRPAKEKFKKDPCHESGFIKKVFKTERLLSVLKDLKNFIKKIIKNLLRKKYF